MNILSRKRPRGPKTHVAALDIGANKVSCVIAKLGEGSDNAPGVQILGLGQQISRGLRQGAIVDMESLEDSILNAVHAAEQHADATIEEVLVSIPASTLHSHIISVDMAIPNYGIDDVMIRRLMSIEASVPADQHLIHALPMSYSVDDTKGIRDPRGLCGEKLGVTLHVITASKTFVRNLIRCIGQCHLDVAGIVAAPYASGLATLVDDELELGATVIDMGGGGTSIASFVEGNLVHLAHIPLGGSHITNDIARGLSTPIAQAERLKTLYGSVLLASVDDRENILVPLLGEDKSTHINQVPKSFLTQIIRARVEEIFTYLTRSLGEKGASTVLAQRLVLTGGGSQLAGLREFVGNIFSKSVRLGLPQGLKGHQDLIQNPGLATCIGVVHYASQSLASGKDVVNLAIPSGNVFQRMVQWIRENF